MLLDLEESRQLEREAQLQTQIVENFKSTASAVHGAVDYDEMKWDSFVKVVETPEQFVFYGERSVQKIIAKSAFTDRREILTLRRVIRRHVRECELRDD
jgi:YcxB-like protein